jgi:hypothetical protein
MTLKKMKMNKPLVLVVLAVCVCLVVFVCSKNKALLKKNGVLTNGRVTNVYSAVKGGIHIDYEFYYKGKKIKGSEFYLIRSAFMNKFEDRTFPVIYTPDNSTLKRMLILETDFNEFDLQYPDSLRWVLPLQIP